MLSLLTVVTFEADVIRNDSALRFRFHQQICYAAALRSPSDCLCLCVCVCVCCALTNGRQADPVNWSLGPVSLMLKPVTRSLCKLAVHVTR